MMFLNMKSVGVCLCLLITCAGCGPAIVGTAAVGAYKGTTDERTFGHMVDDSLITGGVKTRLLSDKFSSGLKIDVDTVEQVVTLTGVVENAEQRRIAENIALATPNVRRVENLLTVGSKSTGERFDDAVIMSKINTSLMKEPGVRSLNIDVDVNQGRVTLTGIVTSSVERDRVVNIARSCPGAISVRDNLVIK